MFKHSVIVGACALLLSGCVGIPRLVEHPTSDQHPLRAVHHWSIHADKEAMMLADARGEIGNVIEVVEGGNGSPFGVAFGRMLVSKLVDAGFEVIPPGHTKRRAHRRDAKLEYTIQTVDAKRPWNDEVIVTTKVYRGGHIVDSNYGVYYVTPHDEKLYAAAPPPKVVPSRSIRSVGTK
ncbi:MAG: hypothetical protein ACPGO3_12210 [Magnetospiraceae bacterium]